MMTDIDWLKSIDFDPASVLGRPLCRPIAPPPPCEDNEAPGVSTDCADLLVQQVHAARVDCVRLVHERDAEHAERVHAERQMRNWRAGFVLLAVGIGLVIATEVLR